MRAFSTFVFLFAALVSIASADEFQSVRANYGDYTVETYGLRIELRPAQYDLFSIALRDKQTGLERRYEFEGEGANDPTVFQLRQRHHCGTSVILLTVEFPWRHALPQPGLKLDTYAFRQEDLAFIDMTWGSISDIALQEYGEDVDLPDEMLPPIRVRCLPESTSRPFEFFRRGGE